MLELLEHPVIGIGFMAILGACVGSFLNVVILRLPVMLLNSWRGQCADLLAGESVEIADSPVSDVTQEERFDLNFPPSHCPTCDHRLKVTHNIPILSFLFLGGRCAWCKSPIGWRYPLVELFTAAATVHLTLHFGIGWPLLAALVFLWSLICLTVIDLDHQLLPDSITLPLLWAGLIVNLFGLFAPLQDAVIGAIAGYLVFWTIYQVHFRLTGREGLGYGDFKLLAAIGAWTGWELLPITILVASLTGTLFAVALMIGRKLNLRAPMSFGPFLAFAGWIALVWGDQIVTSTLPIFSF